jgi:SOS-response transcriptional repressor LexA
MLDGISTLTGPQELHPGGHNWPDMQIVVDPSQTDVEDDGIYLLRIQNRDPVVKRLRNRGSEFMLHPALSTIHGQSSVNLFGRKVPVQTIEFSDNIYKRYVTILGRVVGVWAGAAP